MENKNVALAFGLLTIFFWALFDVYMRFSAVTWQVSPVVFIAYVNIGAAAVLIIIAGPGKLGVKTVKQAQTWAYSIVNVLMDIVFMLLYVLVTTTEGNLSSMISIVFAMLVAWMFLKRKPNVEDWLSSLVIFGGCMMLFAGFDSEVRGLAIFLAIIAAGLQTMRLTVMEVHPASNEAKSVREHCRVSGFVLAVTAGVFLLFALGTGIAQHYTSDAEVMKVAALQSLPTLDAFMHPPTIFAALFLGTFVMSFSTYLAFRVTKVIGGDKLAVLSAFLPLFTFGLEYVADLFGLLDISTISGTDLIAGTLITAAAALQIVMHAKREKARR